VEIGKPYVTHDRKEEAFYFFLRFLTNVSLLLSVVNATSFLWFTGKVNGVFSVRCCGIGSQLQLLLPTLSTSSYATSFEWLDSAYPN